MTTQKLVSLTETQIANVDAALTTLETELAGLIALSATDKRRMRKMGNHSESFSRQALQVVNQNPQMIPANIPVSDPIVDIKLMDQLRPRLTRMSRLIERGYDTEAALGNDITTVALQAYGLLKLPGRAVGMETLRRDLSGMFNRTKRSAKPANDAAAPPRRDVA